MALPGGYMGNFVQFLFHSKVFRFLKLQTLTANRNIEELFLHDGSHVSLYTLIEVPPHHWTITESLKHVSRASCWCRGGSRIFAQSKKEFLRIAFLESNFLEYPIPPPPPLCSSSVTKKRTHFSACISQTRALVFLQKLHRCVGHMAWAPEGRKRQS